MEIPENSPLLTSSTECADIVYTGTGTRTVGRVLVPIDTHTEVPGDVGAKHGP